jgi:hypothetical protein
MTTTIEQRLQESRERTAHWKRWGPYLSERAWGTVREDYSATGAAWDFFPHDHARSRAYRWNEDGIAGISDRHQHICFAVALWNGQDPILKERLFGLTGSEGNHGEDVKECYYYLDNTPTHCYMKALYKYPQAAFPYSQLVEENRRRGKLDPEYELHDTGVFDENRYFDVQVEYAKGDVEDICIRIRVTNHAANPELLHLLPTVWFRNTWSWGYDVTRPCMTGEGGRSLKSKMQSRAVIRLEEPGYGTRYLYCDRAPELLFTENETNAERLFGVKNPSRYVKDGINNYLVQGRKDAVNPAQTGTKASAHYALQIGAGQTAEICLRLTDRTFREESDGPFGTAFDEIFVARQRDADEFYATVAPADLSTDAKNVMRQAFAGMLWSKQFYHYVVNTWLNGDPTGPNPPAERERGRNHEWRHLFNSDVISMPDKWEYPWYAAWDLAFHTIPLALIDSDFAKEQLVLMMREWYMHPNGQIPAYEWAFGDVNPPVHAWAAMRIYQIEKKRRGVGDRSFLERVFHKLLLNFTWWVNRKDAEGRNIFQGGFLGMDNIGVFDRSAPLPTGGSIEQSDGTSWMAMYCLNMLAIALELARDEHCYEDVASKFWEHFCYIAHAMNHRGKDGLSIWDEDDGFYYDVLHDGSHFPMKVRSMVGLIPLFAVETLDPETLNRLPSFKRRLEWFVQNRPDLTANMACMKTPGMEERRLLAITDPERLRRVLRVMLDESEFLSPFGIRSVSQVHRAHPYTLPVNGVEYTVTYQPAESHSGLFGGNSNWRGPIWFPVNYLLIEALQKFYHYLGEEFTVEFPTGSGQQMHLLDVAAELSRRLSRTFLPDESGRRPVHGEEVRYRDDPAWRDLVLFYEYFNGDTGAGVGASHQTGWTGLVAKLLQQSGE